MSQFRQALRALLEKPAFAATALLTIALGIGANTAVYAVVHAVLLSPLPFRQPGRIVQVWESHPELHNLQVAVPDYFDWKRASKTQDIAAYTFQAMDKATLVGHGQPLAVQATNASSNLFPLLGVKPILGRLYTSADERTKQPIVLISEQLWRKKFSADPRVIGRPLQLDALSFTVVGVIPQKNSFPVWADIWIPLSLIDPALSATRKYHPLEVIGRLQPGVSLRQAELEIEKLARELSAEYPATNGKIGAFTVPLMESVTGQVRPALLAVWISVALVLLIACTNLAHLMMSRALQRRSEVALRLALGASRFAVFKAFLTESLLLVIAGSACGLLAAKATLPLVERLAHGRVPRLETVQLNLPVLLFGFTAALVVALLFALPSYLQIFRSSLSGLVSSLARSSARQSWLSPLIMGMEAALTVAVLLSATVLVRSFSLTLATPPGFEPNNILVVHWPVADPNSNDPFDVFRNRVEPALETVPGVQQIAAVNAVPMSLGPTEHSRFATRFGIVGRQFDQGRFPTAQIRWCTPNYFRVLGIPLLRGRLLTEADHNQPRYLINEAFARRYFAQSGAVGQKLLLDVVSSQPRPVEIVGVVADVRELGLTTPPEPTMYLTDASREMDLVIQSASLDAALPASISATLRRINPDRAAGPVNTMLTYLNNSLAQQKFVLALITAFACLAICLCGVGIYGVFTYSVSRRVREFGIRAAIGAARSNLAAQIFKECLAVIVPGSLAGLAISAASSQMMRALLYRISPMDALSSVLVVACVLGLCIASVAMPALRAAKVDPAAMLREQ